MVKKRRPKKKLENTKKRKAGWLGLAKEKLKKRYNK